MFIVKGPIHSKLNCVV